MKICIEKHEFFQNTTSPGTILAQNANVPQATLSDIRDGESYIVRKLADGNCWMVENLRLAGPKTLTVNDSNITSDFYLPAPQPASDISTRWDESDAWTTAKSYQYANLSYGLAYNYLAATAGQSVAGFIGETTASLCSKNWKMPTKNDYVELISNIYNIPLSNTAGETYLFRAPFSLSPSGEYNNTGTLLMSGQAEYYTSSAQIHILDSGAEYNGSAWTLYAYPDGKNLMAQVNRRSGRPIRCVVVTD